MSIIQTTTIPCPSCGTPVRYDLVHSVNAVRMPELRAAILDGSFQLQECPSCGSPFRAEPEFTYLDLARGQYIGVWPASHRRDWRACAERTRAGFEDAFGANAPREARAIGDRLEVRVVFGWPALVEKLIAREAGIDDRTLEVAKLAVLRTQEETPLPGRLELRLVAAGDGDPVLAWVGGGGNDDLPALRVPRALIDEIEADAEHWKAVRARVAEGDVVDFQRGMLASPAPA